MSSVRSIAKRCGVSICTVSKALREDPKVSEETRRRVKEEAERQNYRLNPALSRAAGRRARKPEPGGGEPIALIRNVAEGVARPPRFGVSLVEGARRRAQALGYALEVHELKSYASVAALERVIYARGVRGIILGPFLGAHPEGLPLRWSRYAGVWTLQRWLPLELPLVRGGYLDAVQSAVLSFAALGYRRVGSLLWTDPFFRAQHFAQLAALRALEFEPPAGVKVLPPLMMPKDEWNARAVGAYVEKQRPEVLLAQDYRMYLSLQELGLRIPEDVGVALCYPPHNGRDEAGRRIAAVAPLNRTLGHEAVNLVDAALRHGDYGLGNLRETLVPQSFDVGETLRRV